MHAGKCTMERKKLNNKKKTLKKNQEGTIFVSGVWTSIMHSSWGIQKLHSSIPNSVSRIKNQDPWLSL